MDIKKEVGQRLVQLRKTAGYTQQQVADKLHMVRQAYAKFEYGIFELNYEQITIICQLFDCTSDYLLGLSAI